MRDPGLRSEHEAELQVGLLILVAAAALVGGILWITGADIGGDRFRFHVAAADAAQVSEGTRIFLHGVDVGSVQAVELTEQGVVMQVSVSERVSLPRDSRAAIRASGFLGSQMVELIPGASDRRLAEGDTLSARPSPGLQTVARQLGERVQRVLDRAARALSDTTARKLESGAADLAATLQEIRRLVEEERRTVSRLMESLNRTSRNLADATGGPHLDRSVARIDSLTGKLIRTSESLDASSRALASILQKTDRGQGSLGMLVNDRQLYRDVTAAMQNLQSASEEIALLSKDIRQRPERYLEGVNFSIF